MDLAELKFVVDTKQLELAATRVSELAVEVNKLNKPMQELTTTSTKVSTATEKAAKATETKAKADAKVVDTSSKLDGLLDKLTNRYTDMAKGSTSAEAGVLQLARSLGATTEEALKPYKAILENIRELSKSPFDSAIGSVRSITQEYDSLTYRAELASKGIFLTTAQLKEYSRIANEIKGKLKAADLDPTKGEGLDKFNSELKVQQDLYLGIATKVNTLKTAEKDRNDLLNAQMKESVRLQEASDNLFKYNLIRHKQDQDGYKQDMLEMRKYYSALEKESKPTAQSAPARMDAAVDAYRQNQAKVTNEAAKANAYLAKEMERVNRLNSESDSVTSSTNNRLIRFEQELRKSGASAEEQSHKLALYRKELLATQKAAGNRQVDYLSRALGPQITDIGVGLATGQSPMMVLLQQGGQLRDQFALAGVAGKDMGDMLVKAAGGMVTSIKDVSAAVGQVFVKSIIGVGTAVVDGIVSPFKRLSEARNAQKMLDDGLISNLRYTRLMEVSAGRLEQSFVAAFKVGVVSAVGVLITLGVALRQVIQEESALSKSLTLTGASLGLTTDSALALSQSLGASKGNVGSYVTAITDIAKAGGVTSDNLKTVATTIVDTSKILGISSEDIAKNFSKISEKPLEALIPFAKELGTINVSVLKQIQQLERAGKTTEAVKLATDAYAQALKDAASVIRTDMGAVETVFYGIGDAAKSMWNSILNVGRKGDLESQIKEATASLIEARKGKSWYSRFGRTNEEEVQYYEEIVQSLGKQINAQKELGAAKAKNAKEVSAFEKNLKTQGGAEFKVPEDLYLKQLKEEYRDATKEVDSESKKLLAQNKSSYDLGLIDTGTYLSEELRLIQSQNKQKTDLNKAYNSSFESALGFQITAINQMAAKESAKTKTASDAAKVEEQRVESIKSVTEAYRLLTQGISSNSEVLADNSAEQQAKAIAILGQETKKLVEGSKEFIKTQDDIIAKRALATELEQKTAGLYGAEAERVKAQIAMEQSHIDKLSELQQMALKAGVALSKLTLSGMSQTNPEYLKAKEAVTNAEKSLDDAKAKSKEATEKAGFDAVVKYQDMATQRLNAYGSAFEKMFSGMADAIIEFAKTGKLNFSGLVNSMIEDLIRFEMKKQTMSIYEGLGGAKGIFDMLGFGGGYSGMSATNANAGTSTSIMFANGGSFDNGIQAFANGGAFTNSIVSEPTLFKFAKGTGLMGEAGPEAIMPLRRGSDGSLGVAASGGSGSNVSVQVINNSSSQATTNETVDSKGNRKIEVVIGDMQAGEISRSGSASQKSIKSTFGLQPQLIRR